MIARLLKDIFIKLMSNYGAKSKMKASGQFENIESAKYYATIRSYIETCNRSNVNIYNALVMLAIGKPYTLEEILNGKAE